MHFLIKIKLDLKIVNNYILIFLLCDFFNRKLDHPVFAYLKNVSKSWNESLQNSYEL